MTDLHPSESRDDIAAQARLWAEDARRWIPPLLARGLTAPSVFVPISKTAAAELQAYFVRAHKLYQLHLQQADNPARYPDSPFKKPAISWLDALAPELPVPAAMLQLAADIDAAIAAVGSDRQPPLAFVKLTTRSPKDAFALRRRRDEHEQRGPSAGDGVDPDGDPALAAMGSATGVQALELLATSQRIHDDLGGAELPEVMVRAWRPCPALAEFRCFVCDRTPTAITQYATTASPPYLADAHTRAAVASALVDYLAHHVIPALPCPAYVVDLMLEGLSAAAVGDAAMALSEVRAGTARAAVIEINPFHRSTGAGLFGWVVDADVLAGRAPFELRWKQP